MPGKLIAVSLTSCCAAMCLAVWLLTRTDSRLSPFVYHVGIRNIVTKRNRVYIQAVLLPVSLLIFARGNVICRFAGICLAVWPVSSLVGLYWLRRRSYYRQRDAMEKWPNMLHYMSVACLAGMDVRDSFRLAAGKTTGHLKKELDKVLIRISGGASLKSAIKAIALEDFPQVRRFMNMLSQAEVLGTPVSDVLNSLAQEAYFLERQEFELESILFL